MQYIAIAIHMKEHCNGSTNLLEIDSIYIDGFGWRAKEVLYDYIKYHGYVIRVGNILGPKLVPALSKSGEKYVRSEANASKTDNLFSLPKY